MGSMLLLWGWLLLFLKIYSGLGDKSGVVEFEWLFSDHFEENTEEEIQRNIASSTEDLARLYQYEQEMLDRLLEFSGQLEGASIATKNRNLQKLLKICEKLDQFVQFDEEEVKSYISHMGQPIRSYHLLKRATKIWPQKLRSLLTLFKSVKKTVSATIGVDFFPLKAIKDFPFVEESELSVGSVGGILNIQRYHNISCQQVHDGRLGRTRQGQTIGVEDALLFADTAEKLGQYDLKISWIMFVLVLLDNSQDNKLVKKIKRKLSEAKEIHDRYVMTEGLVNFAISDKNNYKTTYITLFDKSLEESNTYQRKLQQYRTLQMYSEMLYQDLYTIPGYTPSTYPVGYPSIGAIQDIGMQQNRQKLCQGETIRSTGLESWLSCTYHHRGDPYLQVGPFMLEPLSQAPYVGLLHQAHTQTELAQIRDSARGKMKATPLLIHARESSQVSQYTGRRTSKVVYRSEAGVPALEKTSKRLSLATRTVINKAQYDSENYQIMNYGLGGAILVHKDVDDPSQVDEYYSDHTFYGGPRLMTYMIYLSSVEEGGRTVFTSNGVSNKPREGDALFWFNIRSDGSLDTRTFHSGCPVVQGNKWIGNKWVKWHDQLWNYPCLRNKGDHYKFV